MAARLIRSGEWRQARARTDYRAEWLGDMLVERVTWADDAPLRRIRSTVVAAPGYIWFRFWLPAREQVVDRYFDSGGAGVGMHIPICTALTRTGDRLSATDLILGLWLNSEGQVNVLRESEFELAVVGGELTPEESTQAEHNCRRLTMAIAQKRFPPALVRNFGLEVGRK